MRPAALTSTYHRGTKLFLVALLCFLCLPIVARAQGRGGPELPAGDGRDLARSVCATACHDATALMMKRDGEAGWRRNAERMIVQKGAQIFPAELETLIKYLSTELGPGVGRMQPTGVLPPGALAPGAKTVADVRLPAGPGKELVEGRCASCHDLGRVVSIPRKKDEWDSVTRNMLGRAPQASPATPAQVQAIVNYLATHFLEKMD